MAATHAQQMITDVANRMGAYSGGTPERADILRQLNISQREICQEHSLRFLVATGVLVIVNSAAAVPATIDDSKAISLARPSGDGEITYVELDHWYAADVDTYGQGSAQTEPTVYTIAGSTFLFKPAGISLSVAYLAQLRVVAMTDANNSFSVLPEGWEDTLLMIDAEAELRRLNSEPQVADLKARANDKREKLYDAYRTTKLMPWTSRERKERKIDKAQLADEAMP